MRILIAEDDSVLADGLTRSLRQSGYAVDHVKDGQSADLALSAQAFDLLILDLGLPKMIAFPTKINRIPKAKILMQILHLQLEEYRQ